MKQVKGEPYGTAHAAGINAENKTNGSKRVESGQTVVLENGKHFGISINNEVTIGKLIKTISIILKDGKVVQIQ